ncbi:MAG: hypothetical protein QHC90_27570 [Shinella sp.]|nr:hypothetical protein [Shinella sp.]
MPPSVGREIKQSFGDQLRGMRYLVRMLGSDAQRPGLAPPALPGALPELDRLLGKTFRAVDSVMSVVESAAAAVRSLPSDFKGFAPLENYKAAQDTDQLQEDLYLGLKAVASIERPNQLILKSRLFGLKDDLRTRIAPSGTAQEMSAEVLLVLVRRNPLVDLREGGGEADILKQYVAVALLFGLCASGRVPQSEASSLIEDSLLLAGTRIETISTEIHSGRPKEGLVTCLAALLDHLA